MPDRTNRRKLVRLAALSAAGAAFVVGAWAAAASATVIDGPAVPPNNDNFANAAVITGNSGAISGTNVSATGESGEPVNFGFGPIRSVWYSWTAPNAGTATVDLCSGSTFDTTLGIYTGTTVNHLTRVAGNDDSCGVQSKALLSAVSGTTYKISVDGYDGATGSFTLSWSLPAPPDSNDNFVNATAITGEDGSIAGDNLGATGETNEPINAGPGPIHSVWYTWTAPNNGTVTIDTCTLPATKSFDTTIGVYTGQSLVSLTPVATDDDGCQPQSRVSFTAGIAVPYKISVDGYGGATGNFVLTWALAPPNDQFVNATPLTGYTGSISGENVAATEDAGEPANSGSTSPLASVWYEWTAPADGTVTFDTCTLPSSGAFDTTVGAYQGAAVNALTQVATNDDSCGTRSSMSFAVTGGQLYEVSVDGHARAQGSFVLDWNLPVPALSVGDATVVEGNAGTTNATFTVTLSVPSTLPVTVNWGTADGTALAASDYTSGSGAFVFIAGETMKTVVVAVLGDTTFEPDETFYVNLLSSSGAGIDDGQGVGTITNDDPQPSMAIGDASVVEGNSGLTTMAFTVTMSNASSTIVAVDYATADGTAVAPGDYGATSGTLTFTPGLLSRTIAVSVVGDTIQEGDETFSVLLSNPVGGTIADGTAAGTITDDDGAPTLSVNDVSKAEGNSGAVSASFTVSLSNASTQTVTVAWATADGTAVAGSDYTGASGTLSFPPGTTTQVLSVSITG
ncbi:MAG TPA: Calx-beta domain-containing protein, partial [Actinomycetota bacterium]|nr:Calx-beta domain-containing protein [Actinomycetota bacterium]